MLSDEQLVEQIRTELRSELADPQSATRPIRPAVGARRER